MARFLVKTSEFKNVCKAVNDRKLAELKKEIIEILKKQDEKEVKKAIDYFNSQELHYTHLEKSLISGKWIQKAGYGVGTVRIWKGKKYKKIAPGKWARVFDKEGRGTNIAIGKLIARVQKIDNVEDLMAFVMQNKQRFVDENGIDLPVLDKLRAAVDAKNNGGMRSKLPDPKDDNSVAEYKKQIKDKVKEYNMNYEKYLENQIAGAERHNVTENELKALKELQVELKETSKPAEKKEDLEKYNKEMNERRAERQSAEYKEIVDKIPFENDSNKKIFLTGIKAMNISNDMKLDIADWFAKNKIDGRSYADYLIEKVKEGYDKYESSSKGKGVSGKGALYKGNTGIPCDNKAAAYFAQFLAMAKDKGMEELKESEAEKTQNRSEAMKGNQNARKFGADWEEKRKEIQSKLSANVDKMLEGHDKAKDVYEKLQSNLDKRKADAELYRKYLGNQEEPEDVKDFRKWCDDVIEQYRKEVTKTPSKEIISKWEETARNTPTEKLEEVYNGKQKVDYSNEYENFIDSTIINEFAKDKDLVFPQPYTMLKDIATRKFDNSDKIRLEVIKKELDARKNGTKAEFEKTKNLSDAMKDNKNAKKLFTSEDGAEDYFKTIVSPFEFNIGEAKVRMEIREKTNLPPDVSQIPFDLVVVRDNGSTVVSHPKSYDDAYDEILETIRGENSSLSTEWPDMNSKFVRLHNRYAMDSLKALPKEDKYGNKVDDFIDEEIKNKAGSFKKNTKELQNELMSLSKQRNENLDEIKRLNADLAKINQDKYNDKARGNSTTEYDKKIKEINNQIDNLLDGNADIEKRGNDIVKELDKLEKEEKKVIENNPKSIEGMEFVNKNKMHALANFLANHDNVNMATAVIRLQAAYEKLGEEKFLAHFPKDVVERYRKEAGKEETKKESFTPISKDKMKSMSDDELKEYEAKLEKDLLATNRTDPDYAEKYNHWREVHGENNDRFHQAIEDEARAEKQAEADAKSAKEKEIKEKYHGYFDSRSGLDKARDLKTLEKKYNFDGKVMSSKEFVEQAMDNGVEIKEREVNKLDYPSRTRWNRMNGYEQDEYEKRIKAAGKKTVYSINGFEFPKTVVDYAKFYKEKGKSKSGNEKPPKSETAIKNKATSLAGAFGYSKTYAEKMGSPFNLELAEQTVDEELDWDEGSKKALKEELKRIYSEKKVQKSLFDDFVMDMFIDEDEEIEDAIKTDESLFNDYSAEQPELFNSTEMKVQEAFNRCNCCL